MGLVVITKTLLVAAAVPATRVVDTASRATLHSVDGQRNKLKSVENCAFGIKKM
jgi:hypothetical protein